MSRLVCSSLPFLVAAVLAAPSAAHAADDAPLSCSVSVTYTLNNAALLTYERSFVVGLDAPYAEDFSTPTRFRTFDAAVSIDGGDPVVAISFDADVSVFNAVAFDASLRVRGRTGSSTSGQSAFFSSATGAAGSHRTGYTLSCARARN